MSKTIDLSDGDRAIIRRLQGDLPITATPYRAIAGKLGIPAETLMERIAFFRANGLLKRIGAIVRHQNIGFVSNAMVVWRVDERGIEEAGTLFAAQEFVSHCYRRKPLPDFPYTLYTMIHAASKDECLSRAGTLSRLANISDYRMLFSLKELKKVSMRFF